MSGTASTAAWPTQRLSGALDLASVPRAFETVRSALTDGGALVLDLADVDRTDSAALALLVACLREAAGRDAQLRFRHLPADLLKIARVTGLDEVLAPHTDDGA